MAGSKHPPAPLGRDEILEGALRVVERDGLDGLTMRAVGRELGVSAMALYHHISDKEELVRLVAQEIVARFAPLVLTNDGWEEALRRHLTSLLIEQARYPGISGLLISRPRLGFDQAENTGVAFFREAGFDPRTARLAWSFALTYVHGRLSVEANLGGSDPGSHRVKGLRQVDYIAYGVDAAIAGIRTLHVDGWKNPATAGRRAAPMARSRP